MPYPYECRDFDEVQAIFMLRYRTMEEKRQAHASSRPCLRL